MSNDGMTTTPIIPSYTRGIGYQAGLLGGMAMLVSIILMLGEHGTREDIQARMEEDRQAMLSQVLPASLYDNNPLESTTKLDGNPFGGDPTVFLASKDGQLTGAAFEVIGQGYSGDIIVLIGINANGELTGVRTIAHAETPGLGDKIEIAKNDWVTSFNGFSLENLSEKQWAVKKDGGEFDQFTGATITPRAVVGAVHEGLQVFRDQKAHLQSAVTDQSHLSSTKQATEEAPQ
ncbi:electron transport complex subunit RsxG [Marinobacterium mangrovicola]|uniref:Ion-translocating oxidoreductase complex subunit G n=1 Tax=Marinobacterium mangrovicola TaxID=1476959 RepID=A0A4R1GMB8_9GAMM|nr:electron transport complex subunit RsxG [Marinobacterium mangrovicola]TCK08331.1 electron transport complex protein RnfG [Marinobacterium mangrovicola]